MESAEKQSGSKESEEKLFPNIESIIPGLKMHGLLKGRAGLYTSDTTSASWLFNNPHNFVDENFLQPLDLSFQGHEPELDYEERLRELARLIGGKVVVDLGAGKYGLRTWAQTFGASGYIAVEPCFHERIHRSLLESEQDQPYLTIPSAVVAEEMGAFLKRLPNDSVCTFTFGIDDCVLSFEPHAQAIRKELARVLSPDGAHIMDIYSITKPEGVGRYDSYDLRQKKSGAIPSGFFQREYPNYFIYSKRS